MIKTRENAKRRATTTTNKCDASPTEETETHSWWKLFLDYLDFCHLENKSLFHSPSEYRSACAARDRARRALAGVGWWVERAPFLYWIISFINQTIVAQTRRPMVCKIERRRVKNKNYCAILFGFAFIRFSTIFRELKNLLHWPHSVTVAYQIYSHFLFLFSRADDTFTSAHIRMGHVVTRKFHPHYYRIYFISFASSYLASHRLLFRLSGKSVANSFFSRIVHRLFVSADWSSFRLKPFSHFVMGMLLINRANSASPNAVWTGVNNLANHFTWEICIVTLSSPPCKLFTRNTQMCEGSGDGSEMNIENKNACTPLPSMSPYKSRPRPWYSRGNNLEPQCSQN